MANNLGTAVVVDVREGFLPVGKIGDQGLVAELEEATGANVFFIKDGVIHTPTPDCFLNGITRQTVIDLAKARQIEIIERTIMPEEMADFEECFLTGTAASVATAAAVAVVVELSLDLPPLERDLSPVNLVRAVQGGAAGEDGGAVGAVELVVVAAVAPAACARGGDRPGSVGARLRQSDLQSTVLGRVGAGDVWRPDGAASVQSRGVGSVGAVAHAGPVAVVAGIRWHVVESELISPVGFVG